MTNVDQKLDSSLVWDREHLGETALQALADGELDLLPEAAVKHVGACRHCDQRLAIVALQAVDVATLLAARVPGSAPAPAPVRSRRPFPLPAFVVALAVVVTGLLDQLDRALDGLTRLPSLVAHASPVLLRGLKVAFGGATASPAIAAASWVAGPLLVLVGVLIARVAPVRLNKGPA